MRARPLLALLDLALVGPRVRRRRLRPAPAGAAAAARAARASTSTASTASPATAPTARASDRRQIGAAPLRAQTVQSGIGPSLRGVGAQAADFYLRTGYMPLARTGEQPHRTRVLLQRAADRALTAYVASLGPGPRDPGAAARSGATSRRGMHLFTDHCAGCHQIVARGRLRTGAVPPLAAPRPPSQVAEAVRIGPNVMPRFSEKAISDRAARLDHRLRPVRQEPGRSRRLGDRPGRAGARGPRDVVHRAAALVAICMVIGRRLKE